MKLRNLVIMCSFWTNYWEQNVEIILLHIDYYTQRSKSVTGLLMIENMSVYSPQYSNGTSQLRIEHDSYISRLYKLYERAYEQGAYIGIQKTYRYFFHI